MRALTVNACSASTLFAHADMSCRVVVLVHGGANEPASAPPPHPTPFLLNFTSLVLGVATFCWISCLFACCTQVWNPEWEQPGVDRTRVYLDASVLDLKA